jgi:hypothetical protein
MTIDLIPSLSSGSKRACGFIRYCESLRTPTKEPRAKPPRLVTPFGPRLINRITNLFGSESANPFTSLCLNFEEYLPYEMAVEILGRVIQVLMHGLDPADVALIGYLHTKLSSNTDGFSTDIHLGVPNFLLSTGRRWQPYVEIADRPLMTAIKELINYDYGLSSADDPQNRRFIIIPRSPRDKSATKLEKSMLEAELNTAIRDQQPAGRSNLVQLVKKMRAVESIESNQGNIRVLMESGHTFDLDDSTYTRRRKKAAKDAVGRELYDRKSRREYEADYFRELNNRYHRNRALYPKRRRVIHPTARLACLLRDQEGDHTMLPYIPEKPRSWELEPLGHSEVERLQRILRDSLSRERIDQMHSNTCFCNAFLINESHEIELRPEINKRFQITLNRSKESESDPELAWSLTELEVAIKAAGELLRDHVNALAQHNLSLDKPEEMLNRTFFN